VLAQGIAQLTVLGDLGLNNNQIGRMGSAGIEAIANAFKTLPTNVRVDLSGNPNVTITQVVHIMAEQRQRELRQICNDQRCHANVDLRSAAFDIPPMTSPAIRLAPPLPFIYLHGLFNKLPLAAYEYLETSVLLLRTRMGTVKLDIPEITVDEEGEVFVDTFEESFIELAEIKNQTASSQQYVGSFTVTTHSPEFPCFYSQGAYTVNIITDASDNGVLPPHALIPKCQLDPPMPEVINPGLWETALKSGFSAASYGAVMAATRGYLTAKGYSKTTLVLASAGVSGSWLYLQGSSLLPMTVSAVLTTGLTKMGVSLRDASVMGMGCSLAVSTYLQSPVTPLGMAHVAASAVAAWGAGRMTQAVVEPAAIRFFTPQPQQDSSRKSCFGQVGFFVGRDRAGVYTNSLPCKGT